MSSSRLPPPPASSLPPSFAWLGTWSAPGHAPVAVVLAVLVFVTFANSLGGSLAVLDNEPIILRDTRLKEASWSNLWLILTTDYWYPTLHSDLYRPLTTLSYLLDWSVFGHGDDPVGYHVANVILHWCNCLMVYGLMSVVLGGRLPAVLVAALFAVHPLTTEAVANVVGRADLLATAGVLGALLCVNAGDRVRGELQVAWLAGLAICAVIAVFSKESGFAIAVVLPVWDLAYASQAAGASAGWRRYWVERLAQGGWRRYLVVAVVLAACLWIRVGVLTDTPGGGQVAIDNPIAVAGPVAGRMTAAHVLGKYLALTAWPETLSCDYSYNEIPIFSGTLTRHGDWQAWLSLAALVLVALVALAAFRRQPSLFFCLAFAAAMVAPAANILFCTGTIMGERVMYGPLIGLLGAGVCVLSAAYGRWVRGASRDSSRRLAVVAAGLAAIVVAALSHRAYDRNLDWRDEESLWTSAVQACPGSHKVHQGLAEARGRRLVAEEPQQPGPRQDFHVDTFRTEVLDRAARGLAIYDAAPLGLVHEPVRLIADLMYYHLALGDRISLQAGVEPHAAAPAAREWYEKGAALGRRAVAADRAMNDAAKAAQRGRGVPQARVFDTGNPEMYRIDGQLLMRLRRWPEAVASLEYARHLDPGDASTSQLLAECFSRAGDRDRAAVSLLQAFWVGDEQERNAALATLAAIDDDDGLGEPPSLVRDAAGRWRLNTQSPLLMRQLRQASGEMIGILIGSGHLAEARSMYDRAVRLYNVPPDALSAYLPLLQPAE